MNIQDAAIKILKDAGKPLHAKEITERIIEAGLWSSDGKTPEATVSARLYSDIENQREATVKKYLTVRQERNRKANRNLDCHSSDLIIPDNIKNDVVNSFGNLIGIISRVSALKERISTQINVTPVSGGRSSLSGPGCIIVEVRVGGQAND
ncbi:MAG: hypothetical protein ISR96_05280 [Nitrospira sp.]|nr:hypothetical protein [Nitrospira sp.]